MITIKTLAKGALLTSLELQVSHSNSESQQKKESKALAALLLEEIITHWSFLELPISKMQKNAKKGQGDFAPATQGE